jgi:hypothetical protein
MMLGTNDIRRSHVEMLSDSWVDRQHCCRERAHQHRRDAQHAKDRGQPGLASVLEDKARLAEAEANSCSGMIEAAARYLSRFDDEVDSRPADRNKILAMMLDDLSSFLFTVPAPELSARLVRMATDSAASRFLTRRRPKGLPPPAPAD